MIPNEWIFCDPQGRVDKYTGLTQDMAGVRALLDNYATSRISARELGKALAHFQQNSLKAFSLDSWEDLRKQFTPTNDSRLTEIVRLLQEPDAAETRALALLQIWQRVIEFSQFKIREPRDPEDLSQWERKQQCLTTKTN